MGWAAMTGAQAREFVGGGKQISNADAKMLAAEFAVLERTGPLSAKRIVRAARVKASPMHRFFEWDDGRAAERFRLEQARRLIRSVHVQVHVREESRPPVAVRAWVNLDVGSAAAGSPKREYIGMERAMSEPALREQLLSGFLAQMERMRQLYADLTEVAEVFAAVDRVKARTRGEGNIKEMR